MAWVMGRRVTLIPSENRAFTCFFHPTCGILGEFALALPLFAGSKGSMPRNYSCLAKPQPLNAGLLGMASAPALAHVGMAMSLQAETGDVRQVKASTENRIRRGNHHRSSHRVLGGVVTICHPPPYAAVGMRWQAAGVRESTAP